MRKFLDRVYASSPLWVQKVGIVGFGWYWARRRLGGVFEKTCREYIERETWTADRFHDYVEQQLRRQVQLAYREVPYYREAFRNHGISEAELGNFKLDDLPKLPFLEKSTIRSNSEILLTERAAQKPPACFHSSGTTGTPIKVFWDRAVHQHNIAVRAVRSFRWAGVAYQDSRAVVGMRPIVPRAEGGPPYWRYNPWEKQVYLSCLHVSPVTVRDYVYALNRFRPTTLTGFPSALYFLAKLIGEMGLEVHSPRAIITTSEKLQDHMRTVVESVFRTRAFEEYGCVENCGLGTQCEYGRMHFHPDFGQVEILAANGRPAPPGEIGEMVLTGFANYNQPFIRYRVRDLASWSTERCACGRDNFPVTAELVGREEDTVLLRDGRQLVRFDFLFKDLPGVAEAQVVQETMDGVVVHLVPTPVYSESDREQITARAATRLGREVSIEIRQVPGIPREPNGKFRSVISRIPRDHAARSDRASAGNPH